MIKNSKFYINSCHWDEWNEVSKEKLICYGCGETIYAVSNKDVFRYCDKCIDMFKRLAESGIS
ncbi:hypothetical protein QTH25_13405 [Clostridium perfringens]|uniref:hypothetical protein n=1 Tax=Clostridium perfringens TaxID=1502 RepID=UPI00339010B3|nr:hypothetical protein [Clostridium perfringens]